MSEINDKPEWSWAKNDEVLNEITATSKALEDFMGSDDILQAAGAGVNSNNLKIMDGYDMRIAGLATAAQERVKPLTTCIGKFCKMQQVRLK